VQDCYNEAKKAIANAKNIAYGMLRKRLEFKEGENEVFKLARGRERKLRDLDYVRSIKEECSKVLIEDTKV